MTAVRTAILPAAGLATRFLPVTKAVPKELLPLGNKPVIHWIVEEAVAAGVEEIVLVISPDKTAIREYFSPARRWTIFCRRAASPNYWTN